MTRGQNNVFQTQPSWKNAVSCFIWPDSRLNFNPARGKNGAQLGWWWARLWYHQHRAGGYHVQRVNVSIIRTSERRARGCWKKVCFGREIWVWSFFRLIICGGLRLVQNSSWARQHDAQSLIIGGSICFSGRAVEYLSSCVPGSAHTCRPVQPSSQEIVPPHPHPPESTNPPPLRAHAPHEDPDWVEMNLEVNQIELLFLFCNYTFIYCRLQVIL